VLGKMTWNDLERWELRFSYSIGKYKKIFPKQRGVSFSSRIRVILQALIDHCAERFDNRSSAVPDVEFLIYKPELQTGRIAIRGQYDILAFLDCRVRSADSSLLGSPLTRRVSLKTGLFDVLVKW
jgi:hypothetical protein